jgi:hypothetical protein
MTSGPPPNCDSLTPDLSCPKYTSPAVRNIVLAVIPAIVIFAIAVSFFKQFPRKEKTGKGKEKEKVAPPRERRKLRKERTATPPLVEKTKEEEWGTSRRNRKPSRVLSDLAPPPSGSRAVRGYADSETAGMHAMWSGRHRRTVAQSATTAAGGEMWSSASGRSRRGRCLTRPRYFRRHRCAQIGSDSRYRKRATASTEMKIRDTMERAITAMARLGVK